MNQPRDPAVSRVHGGPAAPDGRVKAARGVRLGVDVGTVRVGIAQSDPGGVLATPCKTLPRDVAGGRDLDEIAALVTEFDVVEVVVGLPRTLTGVVGPAAVAATGYGRELERRLGAIPVVFVDERLTSAAAHKQLAARGVSSRQRRAIVDQLAAVEILQTRLDSLRRASSEPGTAGAAGE